MEIQIPVQRIVTIRFDFLEVDGQPATIDAIHSVTVPPEHAARLEVYQFPVPDQSEPIAKFRTLVETRDAEGDPFAVPVAVEADVRIGDGVELRTFVCNIVVYEPAEDMVCTVVDVQPIGMSY